MSDRGLLNDRVAVITGGARGIGFAVGRRFIDEGATVVLADIETSMVEEAAAELGPRASGITVDVTDEDSVAGAADLVKKRHGRVDCLVANAGILLLEPVLQTDAAAWRRVIDVNLTGAFLTCRAFGSLMVEAARGGSIIMTSSLFGIRGGVENGAYSASKFGMIGLMQCLAAELAPHRINVNAVCPGQVDTDMIRQLFHDRAELLGLSESEVKESLLSRVPMGRLASTDEIADTYVYLASRLSSFVTGQSLVVDGGFQVA